MQVCPVNEFHQKIIKTGDAAEIVNSHDVGVVEPGQGLGFAGETFGKSRVAAQVWRQDFQGDDPVQLRLAGLVDHAHAAVIQ
jgi:hypothetical protein